MSMPPGADKPSARLQLALGLGGSPLGKEMDMQRYEALKARYIAANPGATPKQYARAMRRIARRCGV